MRSLAVVRSAKFVSPGGYRRILDQGMGCGETIIDKVKVSLLVWQEDCVSSVAWLPLTGEIAVVSEADRVPSEEDLLSLRLGWVCVPLEVKRESPCPPCLLHASQQGCL